MSVSAFSPFCFSPSLRNTWSWYDPSSITKDVISLPLRVDDITFPMIGSASVTGYLVIATPSSVLSRTWGFVIFSSAVTRRGVSSLKARTIFTISPFLISITRLNQHSNIKSDCCWDLGISWNDCRYSMSLLGFRVVLNNDHQHPKSSVTKVEALKWDLSYFMIVVGHTFYSSFSCSWQNVANPFYFFIIQ